MLDELLKLIKENKVLIIEKGEKIRYTDEWNEEYRKYIGSVQTPLYKGQHGTRKTDGSDG